MFIYSCGTHFLFIQMFSFFGGSQFKNKKSDFGDGGLTFESGLGIIFFFANFSGSPNITVKASKR